MILHCVFCNLRADAPPAAVTTVLEQLRRFSLSLYGVVAFDAGPNRDFEMKSQQVDTGFVIRFETAAALEAYAVHPTHRSLGRELAALCTGGGDGIVVYDLEVD
ncbi:Dabb family protein [Tritonibacter horizontis]|uniref:Stress responsive A/B barrel domain protein n=1 Tax=Tritonibacter horizontis TaxID=1768241 RepID=A0A132BVB6_9RHOB|nr:Dabb family protein [Tritonibacter horizontis]KUP91992.1 stress responsive A/B barrel domain protein [Tritonibacter horizontis]